ncbi:MAG: ammonium transporter [Gammaproteobacteria bacterium]|nr:ammonium transporter [Gammaproteobacteria bacterium]
MQILKIAIAALGLLCLPAFGQDEVGSAATEPVFNALDTLWILLAAFLVFFMQAGFGMLEAGLVRSKNAANIIMKNLLDFCFAALGYFIFGYAIMFGAGNLLFGTSGWFLVGAESAVEGVPLEAVWLFNAVFAGTAATIVAGAVAERMRFVSYLAYSFLISAFIYPVVGHWVWGGGWLAELNFHDFAGSTVVHGVGGMSALVGAWMLGARFGRFSADGASNVIAGHNMPLVGIGVFILWFGWFGFNAGSTLGFGDPQLVARVALNTTLAPSTAAIAAMLIAWIWFGKPDLTIALNGALAGLVGITAPCAVVGPQAALLIGAVAGVLVVLGIDWLNRLRIDDPIGAVPVHALCGIWGTIAVGLFGQAVLGSPANGLFYGGGFGQLGIQCLGVLACLSFTGIAMWVVFKVIDVTIGLRVSHETELRGLDIDEHGMESYGGFQIFITE